MILKLYENYKKRFKHIITEYDRKSFIWGTRDCMLFIADVVRRLSGIDVGERFRGVYWNEKGAMQIIARYGDGSYPKLLEYVFSDFDNVIPTKTFEGVGVCVVSVDGSDFGGVYMDSLVYVFQPSKVRVYQVTDIKKAWEVKRWQ